jgi:hypothetical protein
LKTHTFRVILMTMQTTANLEQLAEILGEVVDDYLERRANGDQSDVDQYVRQHPDLADIIRPSLRALEVVGDTMGSGATSTAEEKGDAPQISNSGASPYFRVPYFRPGRRQRSSEQHNSLRTCARQFVSSERAERRSWPTRKEATELITPDLTEE